MIKKGFLFCIVLLFFSRLQAQSGCTDPSATNYDSLAKTNDGSCLYAVTHKSPILRAAFGPGIAESSGLVFTDGKLWTHDDSGNPAIIFSIDTADGKTLQTVYIDNYPNTDWEDITADSGYIYIGNFGNNNGDRKDLKILKIKKADIGNSASVHVNAQSISFSYNDQTSFVSSSTNNFDCESVISIKDSLYIFTKDRGDLRTRVYKLPKVPGTYPVSPYTSFNVNGLITGADYDSVKKEISLIGYFKGHVNSFIWLLSDFKGDMFFSGNKRRIEIGNGEEWQTEGICYYRPGKLFISCETAGTINASFYTFDTSGLHHNSSIMPSPPEGLARCYPNPAQSQVHFENNEIMNSISVENIFGQVIYTGHPNDHFFTLFLNELHYSEGIYLVNISTASNTYMNKLLLLKP